MVAFSDTTMHAHCSRDCLTGVLSAGVDSRDGCSIVVQYQAEISHLQTMLNHTKIRVEEMERFNMN